jgi:prepilin-type processing-associated H-X9-DG protein
MISIGDASIGFNGVLYGLPIGEIAGLFKSPAPPGTFVATDINPPGHALLPGELAMLRRHAERWNFAFCDGHLEHARGTEFFDWRKDDVLGDGVVITRYTDSNMRLTRRKLAEKEWIEPEELAEVERREKEIESRQVRALTDAEFWRAVEADLN